jgi:Putative phage tail protein
MGFLFPKPDTNATKQAEPLAHIQLQTSSYGNPLPIVYGTQRVTAALIWYDEFNKERHDKSENVGKGGSINSTEYTYSACIMLALCEGPVAALHRVWRDKEVFLVPADCGFEANFLGARSNPTPWTHLTSVHPTKAIGYGGTAWVAAAKLNLPDAALRNHSVEVQGFFALYPHTYTEPAPRSNVQTNYDAHPADIITDLLTSVDYGLGWDPSRLVMNVGTDGFAASSFTTYVHALGFYLSLALNEQATALDILGGILAATNSAAVWSQGKIKFLPYGDTSATGNSHTFTPNLTVQYSLGTDDFLPVADMDPIQVERSNLQDTYNSVPVEFIDRTQDYKQSVVEDPDQADAEAYGLRRSDPIPAHFVTKSDVALALSRLAAQRSIWIRNTYKFKLPQRYILLEPMDLVQLTEPKMGLVGQVVRIKSIDEDPEGNFDITAEEWPFGIGTHVAYTPQIGDGTANDYNVAPGNANTPIGLVPTLQLTQGALELWLVTSGGANWGGAEVWVSDDNTTFAFAGTAYGATYGTITSNISSGATTIPVDLSTSLGTLASTTAAGAADDLTTMWVGGEVFSYQTATLTGANAYSLTGVLRGRQSTTPVSHTSGNAVIRLNENVYRHSFAYNRLGQTLYVKLVSFNKVGGAKQDISLLSSYSFAIPSAPALLPAPTGVTITISTSEPP